MTAGISVVIPTYHGSRFIREALQSVFGQTLLPHEIIVVDDCSSDDTVDVVKAVACDAPVPVRVLQLPKNSGGPAHPINVGVREATGEFVTVLDQDDVFHPEKLAREEAALENQGNYTVAFGFCSRLGSNVLIQSVEGRKEIIAAGERRDNFVEIDGMKMLEILIARGNVLVGYPAFTFRRSLWIEHGGADESLGIASDLEMLGWLLSQGKAALTPGVVYSRRVHDANVSNRRVEMHLEGALVRAQLIRSSELTWRNRELRRRLGDELFGTAYWFREAGEYRASIKMLRLCRKLGIPVKRIFAAMAKMTVHCICCQVFSRPLVQSSLTHSGEKERF